MYQLSTIEIHWENLQSARRMREGYDPTSKDVWQKHFWELATENIKKYEDKLARELLKLYPELRDYMRELHNLAEKGLDADVVQLRMANRILNKEVETLTKRLEKLTKKPTTKKGKKNENNK